MPQGRKKALGWPVKLPTHNSEEAQRAVVLGRVKAEPDGV
jgi:hypothetical protein